MPQLELNKENEFDVNQNHGLTTESLLCSHGLDPINLDFEIAWPSSGARDSTFGIY